MSVHDVIGHAAAIFTGICCMLAGPFWSSNRQPEDRFALWGSRVLVVLGVVIVVGNLTALFIAGLRA